MPLRTKEKNAKKIDNVNDLEEIVNDKREMYRANSAKANQRQRRYKKRLVKQLFSVLIHSNLRLTNLRLNLNS